jgi:hypothetical protein
MTLTVWIAVLLLAGASPLIVFAVSGNDGSVEVVTSFLAAIHRKDITDALRIARPNEQPDYVHEIFLNKAALSTDWRLVSATAGKDPDPTNELDERLVTIRIAGPAGSAATGQIYLVADPHPPNGLGGWRIPQPYGKAFLSKPQALGYLALNGRTYKATQPSGGYAVFPGSYSATALAPTLATSNSKPLVIAAAGDPRTTSAPDLPLLAVMTPAAENLMQTQVRTMIASCARSTSLTPSGCPFRGPSGSVTYTSSNTTLHNFTNLRWKVQKPPALGPVTQTDDGAFQFGASTTGSVILSGRALGPLPGDYTFTMPCTVHTDFVTSVTAPSSLTVRTDPRVDFSAHDQNIPC